MGSCTEDMKSPAQRLRCSLSDGHSLHSKQGEQVKNSSLMCVSLAQLSQTSFSHSPHLNFFCLTTDLMSSLQILQVLLYFCFCMYSSTQHSSHWDFLGQFSHLKFLSFSHQIYKIPFFQEQKFRIRTFQNCLHNVLNCQKESFFFHSTYLL